MRPFRVQKSKPRRSSKPVETYSEKLNRIVDVIAIKENKAMVSCSECVKHNKVCFYNRDQSIRCAECLRH